MNPIQVGPVRVPEQAISMKAVRSGGPGGQNVNKVASKVELRIDLSLVEGLEDGARMRLMAAIRNQLDADGAWLVVSSRTRDQLLNIEDARTKIETALALSLVVPKARHATRPTRGSQARRVDAKKKTGAVKRSRSSKNWD